jgi:hypothetical protein
MSFFTNKTAPILQAHLESPSLLPIDLKGEIQTFPEDHFTNPNLQSIPIPWSDLGLTIGSWVGKLIICTLFVAKYV